LKEENPPNSKRREKHQQVVSIAKTGFSRQLVTEATGSSGRIAAYGPEKGSDHHQLGALK